MSSEAGTKYAGADAVLFQFEKLVDYRQKKYYYDLTPLGSAKVSQANKNIYSTLSCSVFARVVQPLIARWRLRPLRIEHLNGSNFSLNPATIAAGILKRRNRVGHLIKADLIFCLIAVDLFAPLMKATT
jgi:hypothetical protein